MAETTGIAWTRSTFNPWIGCTKVSPGCDHCYAEALDARHQYGIKKADRLIDAAPHWGVGAPRYRTSASTWRHPIRWNEEAAYEKAHGEKWAGRVGFWPVFCASLADVFDNEVPQGWRSDLFAMIDATPNLTWLLLTKRIGNVLKMTPAWSTLGWPKNVWLGASMVDQPEYDRDAPKLAVIPAAKRFISYEPALGPIQWTLSDVMNDCRHTVDWIIVGGESAQTTPGVRKAKARPFDVHWARSTIAQCKLAGVPVFVKQLGSAAHTDHRTRPAGEPHYWTNILKDRAGADPAEWPKDLRLQEFP